MQETTITSNVSSTRRPTLSNLNGPIPSSSRDILLDSYVTSYSWAPFARATILIRSDNATPPSLGPEKYRHCLFY